MPLQALVEDLETIDEGMRDLYRKVEVDDTNPLAAFNGKFILDVQPVAGVAIDHTEGLKSSLSKARGERDDLEKKLKTWEGLEPIDTRAKLEKLDNLQKIDPTKEADRLADEKVNSVKEKAKQELSDAQAKAAERETKLTAQIRHLMLSNAATTALQKHGGNVELLTPHVERQCRVREKEDGTFVTEVLDKSGEVRLKDISNPMSIEDLVSEMKALEPYSSAFSADSSGSRSGTSGTPSGGSAGGNNPWKKDTWNLTEQSRIAVNDPAKAKRLRQEAGAA